MPGGRPVKPLTSTKPWPDSSVPGKEMTSFCVCASPAALGLDAAISPRNEETVAFRLKVGAIVPPTDWATSASGRSRPRRQPVSAPRFLADKVGVPDRANLLVCARIWRLDRQAGDGQRNQRRNGCWLQRRSYGESPSDWPTWTTRNPDTGPAWLNVGLARAWLPEDAGLSVRAVEQPASATGGEDIRPSRPR